MYRELYMVVMSGTVYELQKSTEKAIISIDKIMASAPSQKCP